MKKFLIILCILMLCVGTAFSAPSPTLSGKIGTHELSYVFADELPEWKDIVARLEDVKSETEGFVLLEALKVTLDKPYSTVKWTLSKKVTSEDEPFILIIDSEAIVKQEISVTDEGDVITDFTDLETGIYYILFYIRKGA